MGKTVQVSGFPSTVQAEDVKRFLEQHTGKGTVFAVKVREFKSGGVYAIVQFTSVREADLIISLASDTLWYGSSYLEVRVMDHDIIPKPRIFLHTMENVTLRFGCQKSKDTLSVLWRSSGVSVKFGLGLRQLQFLLSYHRVDYRLELCYENIWQIELRRLRSQREKYLLIQLYGAPKIYQKAIPCSASVYHDPLLNYTKDVPDDQWVRATDFSPRSSIGQSFIICLELSYADQLPNFRENFAYYRETDGVFFLDDGCSFSQNLDLVPIVGPPATVDLPFEIVFKINLLLQNGCLSGPTLDVDFYRLVDPHRMDIVLIESALEKLYHLKECCYNPSTWLHDQYKKYLMSKRPLGSPVIALDAGLVYVRRVQVTPTRVYFFGPEVNVSNRVLRHFHLDIDNFIRVSFVDEELDKIHSMVLSPRSFLLNVDKTTKIYKRILSTLRNGFVIGSKKFEFLAFSPSQLRDNSAWMFSSRPGLSAYDIRKWMGNFQRIRNVAKYAARLGLSFGSSTESLSVSKQEVEIVPDIIIHSGQTKYIFSDGIGKISSQLAKKVATKCGYSPTPSAFQIRYGGYKGVVAVDPTSSAKLSLRKSMCKYESENTELDILAHSKYQPCYLNRQFITLLNTLGVKDIVFEKKQREAIAQLNAMLEDPLKAHEALELMSSGENTKVLKEMLMCGYKPDVEPFLSMMLQTFCAVKLLELRTKTRIYVPNGRLMMGCLDETRTLEYGQVFVQISPTNYNQLRDSSVLFTDTGRGLVVEATVVVAKNPCLHPGDVRVLKAVNVPALHHMVDCVVFPQKGPRPHPNECSGSDLDGDLYFVCWDPELIPPQSFSPMDYNPLPTKELDHDVTIEEVEEYFVNYMVNDSLGIIANAHTAFADREPNKAMSEPCKQLAELFSIAVDFPKTGVPAVIPSNLYVKEYPDFMDKPDKPTYESKSVIGRLYREVKKFEPSSSIKSFTKEIAGLSYDTELEIDGFEDYVDEAFCHKSNYDYKLGNLMDYYGIKTEAEVLSGSIIKMSKAFTRKKDADGIGAAVRSLRKEARTWFKEGADEDEVTDVYAKASAWYHVTYHPSYWGAYNEGMHRDHFLSFPWCVYDKLIHIKKEAKLKRSFHLSSLKNQFRNGLQIT